LICCFALCMCSWKRVWIAISKGCWCLEEQYYDPTLKLCFGIPVLHSSSWLSPKVWLASLCFAVVLFEATTSIGTC
jgi:hypothetical protein